MNPLGLLIHGPEVKTTEKEKVFTESLVQFIVTIRGNSRKAFILLSIYGYFTWSQ